MPFLLVVLINKIFLKFINAIYYRSEVGDLIANIFGESEDEGEFEVSKLFLSYKVDIIFI